MHFRELVSLSRSCRRFDASLQVPEGLLLDLVEMASLAPSARNLQPLRYMQLSTPERCAGFFPFLSWAGYLTDWDGPVAHERPTAYLVMLGEREVTDDFGCDSGIAAQTIMLGATAEGYGGCILGSIDRDGARRFLGLSDRYELLLAIALGVPRELVVIDQMERDATVRYYRDRNGIHHVPKRVPGDLLVPFGGDGEP